jgi:hypothetical protein
MITFLSILTALGATLGPNPSDPIQLRDPFGIAWGFVYGYQGAPKPEFMSELREQGGSCTKLYLIWNQLEPKKGEFDWSSLDAFLAQLHSPEEALISIFSSSTWATRTKSEMLPPSPANDPADYDRFVRALVKHCGGKVRYFQNDSEPNNPIYWSGTAEEFANETIMFGRAVRETDPKAKVVLGGYDGLFNPGPGFKFPTQDASLRFFRQVLAKASDSFDIFDLRLYADPTTIPARVDYIRKMIQETGKDKPIICTEYNGPGFFDFAENHSYIPLVVQWSTAVASQTDPGKVQGVADLYKDPQSLNIATRMFLLDSDKEADDKLRRLQCRDLVARNILALSAGVQRTMLWDFWHDTSNREDVMTLMYGKLRLFDREDGRFIPRQPLASAFQLMSKSLQGVRSVRKVESPTLNVFESDCGRRGTVLVAWKRVAATAESNADTPLSLDWKSARVYARDALGKSVPINLDHGTIQLMVGSTPVFVSPTKI